MKKLLFFFVCLPFISFGQEASNFTILEHTATFDIIKVKVGELQFFDIPTPNGIEKRVVLPNGSQLLEKAAPDLPKLAFSLIVPGQKDARVEILSSNYTDISNIEVAPSKGKMYRHLDPDDYPYLYGDRYQSDEFYPSQLSSFQKPYIMRDFRAQALHVFPVQYNPISKTIRKYDELILKVSYDQPAYQNILVRERAFPKAVNAEFNEIYKYQFLNYKTLGAQYTPLAQTGSMLILCPSKYEPAMHDFIEWKERKGYKVFFELTDTITGGPSEANLKARVSEYYNQKQITYLLIVGDATDVLAQNSYWTTPGLWGPSDWAYAYQSGNDHYPEFMVGRFSADTLQDVITQVKRTLLYERQPNTSSTWMHKQVAIGSDQGPGDKGEFDHEHLRGIADSNKNFGNYVYNYEFFDGTHGGNDAPGGPPVESLRDAINDGVGLINYCGHGTTDMFVTSTFIGANEMANLTNSDGRWPVIFSTACINGNFVYARCLAENFLRAVDSLGNPKGAVAAIMSSINQSWDPPMEGQDEMNALLRHDRPGTYQTTFGAITSSGIMSTNDHYNTNIDPDGGNEIADTWVVFADPSLVVYTKDEGTLNCTHNATIGKGSDNFEIQCTQENTQIGLYYQGDFLASAVVQNGKAVFNFPAVQNLDTIFVTATKQNFMPYYGKVAVVNAAPFGVEDLALENIQIYPNPATDILNIKDVEQKVERVEILDISGKTILTTTNKNVPVGHLPIGIYQLRLSLKNKVIVSKFSKY